MTLTIDLTPEQEVRLAERARLRGLDVEKYVLELLELPLSTSEAEADEVVWLAGLGTPEEEEEDERLWQEKFAAHPEVIARLLAEAEEDIREGRTAPLDELLEEVR